LSSNHRSHPAVRIVAWALGVGFVSLAAGWFGPAYFAPSNLGSLIGIFVTGPLGTLAGALIGALGVAKDSRRLAIACIGLVWVMTLLYTFWAFSLGGWAAIPAVPLQLLVLASIIYLFFSRPDTQAQPPDGRRRCGAVAVAALVTILLMTLFPPVIRPWWVPAADQARTDAPLPSFAFVFDRGFHTSGGYPLFDVNRGELAAEWIITAVVAIGFCLLMRALRSRPAP
jgi:hypothetical protein